MWNYILAVLITCIGVFILCYVIKAVKGITLRIGAAGLVLIFLPNALAIAGSLTDTWYFGINIVSIAIGIVFLLMDIPNI